MDERPRNLKAMLSEAKDTSELMVDLGYAALFFADERMADEVQDLEERLTDLIHEMREVCVLAGRSKRDAEQIASVVHVVAAIERMGNAAVDISNVVMHRLGIPAALVAGLAGAEEVSHRVRVRADSALANRSLEDVELPMEVGMRVVALRRGREWLIDPDGDEMLLPDDVLIMRGAREGIGELRELAGAPAWRPAAVEENPAISDLDRAVGVLDGATVAGKQVGDDTGFHLLAIKRGGRYFYRPRRITLQAGDEILAAGPGEGRRELAQQCGFRLVEDDDTGAVELVRVD